QHPLELADKGRVVHRLAVVRVQFVQGGDERLRHEAAPERSKVSSRIRLHAAPLLLFPNVPTLYRAGLGVAGWLPALTSSATASRGLFWVTKPSPTSTASAPADAYRIKSCGPRTPDSAIFTT